MKKTFIAILSVLLCTGFIYKSSSQSLNSFDQKEQKKFHNFFTRSSPTLYLPHYETDSSFTVQNGWYYSDNIAYTYYANNCLDSMDLYTFPGANSVKFTFAYDQNNYNIYTLIQQWINNEWVNANKYIGLNYSNTCLFKYMYQLGWNGSSWDTTYGEREVDSFTTDNQPLQRIYINYSNGQWINHQKIIQHYNNNQLIGMDYYNWNSIQNKFIPYVRDTDYTYQYYNSFCDNEIIFNITQSYHNGWQDSIETYNTYSNANYDTTLTLVWNGSSYDSSQLNTNNFDDYGNSLGGSGFNYNHTTLTWDTDFIFIYQLSYGPNHEVIRSEQITDGNYQSPDSIYPQSVSIYSDFIPCTSSSGINNITTSPASVNLYPNPNNGSFTIQLQNAKQNTELDIFNVLGEKIYTANLNSTTTQIILNNHVTGIYLYRVLDEQGNQIGNGKFIVE